MTLTRSSVQFPAHAMPFRGSAVMFKDWSSNQPLSGSGYDSVALTNRGLGAPGAPPRNLPAPPRDDSMGSDSGQSYPGCLLPPIAPEERGCWSALRSPAALGPTRTDGCSSRTFIPSFHFKFDACPLFQCVKVESLKAAAVEEYFLAFGGAYKPEPTVTDDSLDCPLHGHLGQRAGSSRGFEKSQCSLRVKSPHAPLAQPYHHRSRLSKAKLHRCMGVAEPKSQKVQSRPRPRSNWWRIIIGIMRLTDPHSRIQWGKAVSSAAQGARRR